MGRQGNRRLAPVNGEAGVMIAAGDEPTSELALDVSDGLVRTVRLLANPEKLSGVRGSRRPDGGMAETRRHSYGKKGHRMTETMGEDLRDLLTEDVLQHKSIMRTKAPGSTRGLCAATVQQRGDPVDNRATPARSQPWLDTFAR